MVFCEHAWYFACFWHRFNVCARVRRKSYKNERNLLGILSSFLAHLLKFTKKKFESLSREPWCPPVCPPSTHCDAVNRTQCQHAFTPWPTSRLLSFPWFVFYIEENVRHHIPALYGFRLLRGATVFRYYIWYSRYSSGQNGVTFILSGPWSTTATYSIAAIWHKGTMANSEKKAMCNFPSYMRTKTVLVSSRPITSLVSYLFNSSAVLVRGLHFRGEGVAR